MKDILRLNVIYTRTIQANDYDKGYAIIKAIFKHKGNDDHHYPFIYVDWFEDINKKHKIHYSFFELMMILSVKFFL